MFALRIRIYYDKQCSLTNTVFAVDNVKPSGLVRQRELIIQISFNDHILKSVKTILFLQLGNLFKLVFVFYI